MSPTYNLETAANDVSSVPMHCNVMVNISVIGTRKARQGK